MSKTISPEYSAYLLTREWQHARQDALKTFGDACMACNRGYRVQLHHVHYPIPIEATQASDLMPLCEECHHAIHRQHEFYPTTRTAAHAPGKRAEILAYLARFVTRRKTKRREPIEDKWKRDMDHPKRRVEYFAIFPQIREAMVAFVHTSHQRNHPWLPHLSNPRLHPDLSRKMFGQIIGKKAGEAWLKDWLTKNTDLA